MGDLLEPGEERRPARMNPVAVGCTGLILAMVLLPFLAEFLSTMAAFPVLATIFFYAVLYGAQPVPSDLKLEEMARQAAAPLTRSGGALPGGWTILVEAHGRWERVGGGAAHTWSIELEGPEEDFPLVLEIWELDASGEVVGREPLARSGEPERSWLPGKKVEVGKDRWRRALHWKVEASCPEERLPGGAAGGVYRGKVLARLFFSPNFSRDDRLHFSRFVRPEAPSVEFLGEAVSRPLPDTCCQVCGGELSDPLKTCPACETPHHEACWKYAGGCATYGCSRAPR